MILVGDNLQHLPTVASGSVQCCVTSPPYFGLRDYGVEGQHGAEATPEAFVDNLVAVFREVRRALKDDGTLWLNLGDSYNDSKRRAGLVDGLKHKDLLGIPWMVAFALRADGWWLRQEIIWAKPNPMPESVTDRCTKNHEHVFLLTKSPSYYFDADAIAEPAKDWSKGGPGTGIQETQHYGAGNGGNAGLKGIAQRYKDGDAPTTRNKRTVWNVATQPFAGAHFATFPEALVRPCILAGSRPGDVVLDPYLGAGTTAVVAQSLGREYVGCELNPDYAEIARRRIAGTSMGLPLFHVEQPA